MPKFRKKPVVIEAVQWTGQNLPKLKEFCPQLTKHCYDTECPTCIIRTLEGTMEASSGDWIIKGVKGEFYPCKPDIFEKTYEPVEE